MTPKYETDIDQETAKGVTRKQWQSVKEQTTEVIVKMIEDIKTQMGGAGAADW